MVDYSVNIPEILVQDFSRLKLSKDKSFRNLLPIEFVGNTGAIVIGNSDIPSMLIAQYKSIVGTFETSAASTSKDYYMTSVKIQTAKLQIKIRSNVDYKDPLSADDGVEVLGQWSKFKARFIKADDTQRLLFAHNWNGLPRYRFHRIISYLIQRTSVGGDDGKSNHSVMDEYAKVTTILSAKEVKFDYSYDIPGLHTIDVDNQELGSLQEVLEYSPKYALQFSIEDGNWNYGPWAERQRNLIQDYFFPVHYQTLIPSKIIQVGESREYKAIDINIKMKGQVGSIRIPFRNLSAV